VKIPREQRNDIQGLRAVAVLLVVVFHAFAIVLPGGFIGVDVFYVISGFIITTQLLGSLERTGTIGLRDFYSKRIKRLLPAAILVVLATLVAAVVLLPQLFLQEIGKDGLATSLYVSNYWFALSGTDYWADEAPALFQHYWSLAVEEQYYLVWPILLLLVGQKALRRRPRIAVALLVLTVLSLTASVIVTSVSQPWAFFSLPTRAWELAIGALVATLAIRLRAGSANIVAALGIVGVVASGFLFSERLAFPGWIALLPVVSTAAVLLAGPATLVGRALSWRPLTWIGDRSYSLYLWHWPVLLIPALAFGELSPVVILALLALCFVLSAASYRFVENPFRRLQPKRRSVVFVAAIAATLVAVLASVAVIARGTVSVADQEPAPVQTAGVTQPDHVPGDLTPTFDQASADKAPLLEDGCMIDSLEVESPRCIYGEATDGPKVVLFGDSHAAHWFPAFEQEVLASGGELLILAKTGCPSVTIPVWNNQTNRDYSECYDWREASLDRINDYRPDVVLVANWSGYRDHYRGDDDFVAAWRSGLETTQERINDVTTVAVIEDTPSWPESPNLCLSANLDDLSPCETPLAELSNEEIIEAESEVAELYVPTLDLVCTDVCFGINGNVLLYRDSNHLTATASRSLGPLVWARIWPLGSQ
jgi:peptidoglycan/LPS O-acetylase OafA/YrhL